MRITRKMIFELGRTRAQSATTALNMELLLAAMYLAGIVGLVSPFAEVIKFFSPVTLLVTAACLLLRGISGSSQQRWTIFAISAGIGTAVEIIGVNTGWPFGAYSYGETLGLKIFGMPLIIAVNWFILTVCAWGIAAQMTSARYLRILIASILMVGLDFIIEPIAVKLDFWTWTDATIPISNYLTWFLVSAIVFIVFDRVQVVVNRRLALFIFSLQTLFFGALVIFDLL